MEIIKHVFKYNTQLCQSCGGEQNYFLQQSALIAKLYALTLESYVQLEITPSSVTQAQAMGYRVNVIK